MGSTTGLLFRLTTFGESHGGGIGCVLEGCPPGLLLDVPAIQDDLERRRRVSLVGQSPKEPDELEILSGVFEGRTLGSPIAILVRNKDANPAVYAPFKISIDRPSDTRRMSYGLRNWQGGGRASRVGTSGGWYDRQASIGASGQYPGPGMGRQVIQYRRKSTR